jgi:hypothetical protein
VLIPVTETHSHTDERVFDLCMSLRRFAWSSMHDMAWSTLSRGRSTFQPVMAVVLVMRVSQMAHLCGNLPRAGLAETFAPASGMT